MVLKNIGNVIQQLREKKHLNQNELAEIIPISVSHLSKIESGKKVPSLKTAVKICDVFGLSFEYVVVFAVTKDQIPKKKRQDWNVASLAIKQHLTELFPIFDGIR